MIKAKKTLYWIIILLVVFNFATIGTIVYHNINEQNQKNEIVVVAAEGSQPLNGYFFRHELNFDDNQMDDFRKANRTFHPIANKLVFELDSIKHVMFNELNKQSIDTGKIEFLTKTIGQYHSELKRQTNIFYLNLQKTCNEKQRIKLQKAFEPLYHQGYSDKEEMNKCRSSQYKNRCINNN